MTPLLGGIEYTDDLVNAMYLPFLESEGESLGRLIKDLRSVFKTWEHI